MSLFRYLARFANVLSAKNVSKVDRFLVIATLLASITVSAFVSSPSQVAHAARSKAATSFLTLPFVPNSRMSILSGWYYSSSGGLHNGIDFINGDVDGIGGWRTFPIVASADGEACGNCSSRQGNAVWIKHELNGAIYYTYYGHLASIAKGIPLGSQSNTVWVKRGQVIGMAGDTGSRGALHLHFALYSASSQPLDPYSIGKLRQYYPRPDEQPGVGWFIK
jgi:murein DD-endopeptidase MepM/ murein hydrolase activator NlpD